MSEIKRLKKLSSSVDYVSLSEQTLYKIAKRVTELARKYEKEVKIVIQHNNGEDEYISNDYNVFLSAEIPNYLKAVMITFLAYEGFNYNEPLIECKLKFDTKSDFLLLPRGVSEIEVKGIAANDVTGLYHDIKQILLEHRKPLYWFFRLTDNLFFSSGIIGLTFFGVFAGTSTLMSYGLSVMGLPIYNEIESKVTSAGNLAIGGSLIFSLIAGVLIGTKVANLFNSVSSKIEFSGKLSDHNINKKRVVVAIFAAIYALILNLLASVIYSAFSNNS